MHKQLIRDHTASALLPRSAAALERIWDAQEFDAKLEDACQGIADAWASAKATVAEIDRDSQAALSEVGPQQRRRRLVQLLVLRAQEKLSTRQAARSWTPEGAGAWAQLTAVVCFSAEAIAVKARGLKEASLGAQEKTLHALVAELLECAGLPGQVRVFPSLLSPGGTGFAPGTEATAACQLLRTSTVQAGLGAQTAMPAEQPEMKALELPEGQTDERDVLDALAAQQESAGAYAEAISFRVLVAVGSAARLEHALPESNTAFLIGVAQAIDSVLRTLGLPPKFVAPGPLDWLSNAMDPRSAASQVEWLHLIETQRASLGKLDGLVLRHPAPGFAEIVSSTGEELIPAWQSPWPRNCTADALKGFCATIRVPFKASLVPGTSGVACLH